ncbi:MAG: GNAT family N-acetyltransferase [bacterium]|nr:GNAT family N-acetyltransferase [bacterium]
MIKIIDNCLPKIEQSPNIAWVRIEALYLCYGTGYPFLDFWVQTNQSCKTTAVICRFYNSITVWNLHGADDEELSQFLDVISGDEVFCTFELAKRLSLIEVEKINVLSRVGKTTVRKQGPLATFEQIYEILNSGGDGDIELPDYSEWYPDFVYRFRHKAARYCLNADKTSVAITGFETSDFAIICGVATLPLFRNRGYAADVVETLYSQLAQENKTVYVATRDKTVEFYKKLGFTVEPIWFAICKKRGNR